MVAGNFSQGCLVLRGLISYITASWCLDLVMLVLRVCTCDHVDF